MVFYEQVKGIAVLVFVAGGSLMFCLSGWLDGTRFSAGFATVLLFSIALNIGLLKQLNEIKKRSR